MTPVRCGDCKRFVRSTINPSQGMGRCLIDAPTRPATHFGRAPSLWPFSERLCREFLPCT